MAVTLRPVHILLAAAALTAVAMPALLLTSAGKTDAPVQEPVPVAVRAAVQPPAAALFQRPLFAPADAAAETAPADAPVLVGIVGRLDQDAVALVRGADGATRSLGIGQSVDGWVLASLAIDAAFFTRGTERIRVPLPIETDQ